MKKVRKTNSVADSANPASKVKVLYQNLNGVWYAFADVGGEVFYTPVDYKKIQQKTPDTAAIKSNQRKVRKITPADAA